MNSSRFPLLIAMMIVVLLTGCDTSRKAQLQRVAQDWCETIRASQVLPVYPLTEDLQPGDLFLVQLPVDKQHAAYDAKGFLAFDNHLARLNPDGYKSFYDNSFELGSSKRPLPKWLLKPGKSKDIAWKDAPQAGFPSYTVSVRRGGGFSAALPISGVPVGLSLLGSEAADATITIDRARTYGIDTMSLHLMVVGWAEKPTNRAFLASYASTKATTNYLRVVNRVYLTGRLLATMTSATANSAGASVGAPKPVDLLTVAPGTKDNPGTAASYSEGLTKLNGSLTEALKKATVNGAETLLPGATLKVVAASSRSITMAEDFIDRPLVIGYLGFDYAIGPEGKLGPPIPTHAVVDQGEVPSTKPFFTATLAEINKLREQLSVLPDADKRFDVAASLISSEFNAAYIRQRKEPRSGKASFNSELVTYLSVEPSGSGQRHFLTVYALQQASAANVTEPSGD